MKDENGNNTEEDKEVDNHEDLTDEDQSVHYPEVRTTAVDTTTDDHIGAVASETEVKDAVIVKNLIPGETYTITGTLMRKGGDTADQKLLDKDGKVYTATETFTAKDANETHVLTLSEDPYFGKRHLYG